jgi:hypothetical protein
VGRKRHDLAIYVVSWDALGIVKVGTTNCQRWRTFVLRGARLVGVRTMKGAFDLEGAAHQAIASQWKPAFADRTAAAPFLGNQGSGWCECYLMPAHEAVAVLKHMLASNAYA